MSIHPTFDLRNTDQAELKIAFTEANHAHVSGDITVRGIQYHVGVHIFAHPLVHSDSLAPTFLLGRPGDSPYQQYQHLHATRKNAWNKPVSDAARASIQREVERLANEFLGRGNSDILRLAQANMLRAATERAEHAYAEAMAKADEARNARDEAQFAEDQFRAVQAAL
jgi:hypothetical protein